MSVISLIVTTIIAVVLIYCGVSYIYTPDNFTTVTATITSPNCTNSATTKTTSHIIATEGEEYKSVQSGVHTKRLHPGRKATAMQLA